MKKRCLSVVFSVMLAGSMLLAGCDSETAGGTRIDFYSGDEINVNGDMRINEELFFRNGLTDVAADPFVFDNTEGDGHY